MISQNFDNLESLFTDRVTYASIGRLTVSCKKIPIAQLVYVQFAATLKQLAS